MAVYVDAVMPCRPWGRQWPGHRRQHHEVAHLFADAEDELHELAARIGLRRAWFQDHPRLPHYDLTASKRRQAVAAGAVEVSALFVVAFLGRRRRSAG